MPLPTSAPRTLKHTRVIECKGYEREDGLWDIEGHLVDTKTYVHSRRDGGQERQPGDPVHNMWLRLTIDLDLKIHDVEAVTDDGPYEPCGTITGNFKKLAGLTIGPGWRKAIAERVGGVLAARTSLNCWDHWARPHSRPPAARAKRTMPAKPVTKKPYQINSCHIYKDDSPAVLERWPKFYTGKR